MRIISIVAILVLCACTSSTAPEKKDKTELDPKLAVEFANRYVEYVDDRKKTIGRIEWLNSQSILSSDFKSALNEFYKSREFVGFDPILDAQDYPDQGFEVDSVDSNYVIVKGVDWEEFRVTLKLIEINGEWHIDGSGVINVPPNRRIKR